MKFSEIFSFPRNFIQYQSTISKHADFPSDETERKNNKNILICVDLRRAFREIHAIENVCYHRRHTRVLSENDFVHGGSKENIRTNF